MSLSDAIKKAKKRRKPSGFRFVISDGIEFVKESDWDLVAAEGSLFLQRHVLSVIERHGPEGIRFQYAMIYESDRPVAIVSCQLMTVDGTQLVADANRSPARHSVSESAQRLQQKSLRKIRRRVIVCGSLIAWGPHGVRTVADVDGEKIWDGIAEALYRIRRGDRLHGQTDYVLVKDIPPLESTDGSGDGAARLQDYRYVNHATEPNMVLNVDSNWKGFEDYLSSLNKKYRKAARSVFRGIDDAELAVEHASQLSEDMRGELHRLYLQTYSRAKVRPFQLPEPFLGELGQTLGADLFRCTIVRENSGRAVGFVTTVKDAGTAIGFYLGVDYDANASAPIYHRLLYAVIEDALDLGCERISFGRTALEPKARLGCQPESMSVSIRHRVPLVNLLIEPLLHSVQHDEPPVRSPFKSV